jgi:hypothetical protein
MVGWRKGPESEVSRANRVCLLVLLFASGSEFLRRVHLISPTPAEMFCAVDYRENMAIVVYAFMRSDTWLFRNAT